VPSTVLPPLAAWNGSLELAGDVADYLAEFALPGGRRYTQSTSVADVDADGFVDIVVGNANGENQILFGSADGRTFSVARGQGHSVHLGGGR